MGRRGGKEEGGEERRREGGREKRRREGREEGRKGCADYAGIIRTQIHNQPSYMPFRDNVSQQMPVCHYRDSTNESDIPN